MGGAMTHRRDNKIQTCDGARPCAPIGRRPALFVMSGVLTALALLPMPALAQAPNPLLPRNLSPWGMFLNADIVVKAVMIGLAFASLVTWTVWLAKTIELGSQKRTARRRLKLLESG